MTSTTAPATNFYDVMAERGLVAQCTETDDGIRKRLSQPVTAYCGFDPTADSLHVGSLVPIMGLAHLQRCGHRPLVLVGGATGMVGDPSGKSEARNMLDEQTLQHNVEAIAKQIGRFLRFAPDNTPSDDDASAALMLNNYDWIGPLSWLEVLRDVGSKMSVNRMIGMESVKQRMTGEGEGISYLEFSYMLLQAYDFAHLFNEHRCTLQIGGQDQWGNIVMGIELGRKLHDAELAGLTFPLVTKSDGGKFGKSEAGNVWLDANRTSPFDFYQFWRNVADADVGRYLGYFTFLPMDEVNQLASAEGQAINESKIRLAYEVTKLVHGEDEAVKARDAASGAFAGGGGVDVTGDSIPSATITQDELAAEPSVLDLLVTAGLAKSKGEARRLVQGGGVKVHDTKIADIGHTVGVADAPDGYVLLRAGKKRLFRFDLA
ncbi:tyrosine--tRNA ligase [Algisphaera agarilytica]|uniref:Tyrosine--tRNA ligase n=1 Tax=Algisphaera agarilytica TaxID=1385975 RepID=A0A7X0LJC0_9BACT|nr:tyrosine--tRNA ligase [Algisphaera agarilytica]MBB6428687.1 tyrosyl-tRNA synthetase [Algisphaera agarilytica]